MLPSREMRCPLAIFGGEERMVAAPGEYLSGGATPMLSSREVRCPLAIFGGEERFVAATSDDLMDGSGTAGLKEVNSLAGDSF